MDFKATIDRFEGGKAVLITAGKEIIEVPKKCLPADANEGDAINLNIGKPGQGNKHLAKEILNEILRPDKKA